MVDCRFSDGSQTMGRRPAASTTPLRGRHVLILPPSPSAWLAALGAGVGGASWGGSQVGRQSDRVVLGPTTRTAGGNPENRRGAQDHGPCPPREGTRSHVGGDAGHRLHRAIHPVTGSSHRAGHTDYRRADGPRMRRISAGAAGRLGCAKHGPLPSSARRISSASPVTLTRHSSTPSWPKCHFAEARGLVVVLNLQWQLDAAKLVESMPTRRSEAFWASPRLSLRDRSQRRVRQSSMSPAQRAAVRLGVLAVTVAYAVVHQYPLGCRPWPTTSARRGAPNLFWVEGISAGSLLKRSVAVPHHRPTGPLEYSEHRPAGEDTKYQTWDHEFGYIARSGHAPVRRR